MYLINLIQVGKTYSQLILVEGNDFVVLVQSLNC